MAAGAAAARGERPRIAAERSQIRTSGIPQKHMTLERHDSSNIACTDVWAKVALQHGLSEEWAEGMTDLVAIH